MLEIKNLTKQYNLNTLKILYSKKKRVNVLDNINLRAKDGDIIALLGKNGSGKTTFLKIIAGILLPDEGKVKLRGNLNNNKKMVLVNSNDRSFFWRLSILENLKFFSPNKFNSDENINSILSLLELDTKKNQIYLSLSSGEKKRLSIARALIQKPKILLLDEFTSSLDILLKDKILKVIKKLVDTKIIDIVLYSTHSLDEVIEIANKYLYLDNGKIIIEKKVNEKTDISQIKSVFEKFNN